jgi:hypothetical protein
MAAAATVVRTTPTTFTATTAAAAATAAISVLGRRCRSRLVIVPIIRGERGESELDPEVFTRHGHERLNAL